mgnify:CR=1 FL=1
MDILDGLDPWQLEAVTSTEGYIRVIAGAGSGKTRALAHRFAYLVNEIGILPSNILCVTFSNKSANEMKKRIRALTGDSDTGYISTFHSFCVSVLQEDINAVQYPKSFIVLDNADIDQLLAVIYEERGLSMRHMTFSAARDMIEMRKTFSDPLYYEPMLSLSLDELRQKYLAAETPRNIIFWGYVYQEKKCFALDYNDLINFVLHIFSVSAEVRAKWQERLEYIMVDEYQDIDELQYRLMRALCPGHGNLFIVGDPDQTIYTWRGASVRYILDFEKDFPNVRTIMMNTNYRSTPQIIAAANSLISANVRRIKKDLVSARDDGALPVYHHAKTSEAESRWIAARIRELADSGVPYSHCAVLYRAHYLSRTLEDVFLDEELPYTIYSGIGFFDRAEIRDALAYLRMAVYRDDLAFLRIANVPRRSLGTRRMRFLRDYAAGHGITLYEALKLCCEEELFKSTKARQFIDLIDGFYERARSLPLSELLSLILDESGYEAMLRLEGSQTRLDNLAELKQSVLDYELGCGEECSPEDYLSRVALLTGQDAADSRNAVRLMSVHTAKGLEFPHVFVCGLNETIFPSKKTSTPEGMEEERRLAFVALTRAKDGLYLSDAEGRNLDGSYRYPSRFIFNIDRELLQYTSELDAGLVSDAAAIIRASESSMISGEEYSSFAVGDRIRHAVMGPGTILDIDSAKCAFLIKYDSLSTPRKISFRAKLMREEND